MKDPKLTALSAIKNNAISSKLKKFKKEPEETERKESDEPSLVIRIARLKDKK